MKVPFVDLKAGDEVFANVCLALAERACTGKGSRIDVSMAQAAVSWLVTTIPLLDLGYSHAEVTRSGNEHREFVPVNVYPTSDGYIYLAIGNDVQWSRLAGIDAFAAIASPKREVVVWESGMLFAIQRRAKIAERLRRSWLVPRCPSRSWPSRTSGKARSSATSPRIGRRSR